MESEPPQNTRADDESRTSSGPRCPDCNGTDLDKSVETIDAICDACGYVIHDFANPAEFVETNSADSVGHNSPEQQREQGHQMEWSEVYTVTNNTEQRVASAFEHLEELADTLALTAEVRKRAATLIATGAAENLIDGRRTEAVVAALLHIAAREAGDPRPIALVAKETISDTESLNRLMSSLRRELDLEYPGGFPEEYLPYLCDVLEYGNDIESQARSLIDAAQRAGLTNGKSPTGIASAALYYASEGERSQRDVATTVGVSKETIRVRIKEFRNEGILNEQA